MVHSKNKIQKQKLCIRSLIGKKKQLGNRNKGYNRKRNLERKIINKNNIYSFSSVSAMVAITDLMRTFEELKEVIVELTIRG